MEMPNGHFKCNLFGLQASEKAWLPQEGKDFLHLILECFKQFHQQIFQNYVRF